MWTCPKENHPHLKHTPKKSPPSKKDESNHTLKLAKNMIMIWKNKFPFMSMYKKINAIFLLHMFTLHHFSLGILCQYFLMNLYVMQVQGLHLAQFLLLTDKPSEGTNTLCPLCSLTSLFV